MSRTTTKGEGFSWRNYWIRCDTGCGGGGRGGGGGGGGGCPRFSHNRNTFSQSTSSRFIGSTDNGQENL